MVSSSLLVPVGADYFAVHTRGLAFDGRPHFIQKWIIYQSQHGFIFILAAFGGVVLLKSDADTSMRQSVCKIHRPINRINNPAQ